jgi:magnesium transporter
MTDWDQSLLVSLPQPKLPQDASANERLDIYRGRTSSVTTISRPPSPDDDLSLRPSLSDSMLGRGRLGALAAVVELAITRWARRNSSVRSSSSSSNSGSSAATSRSQRARLRKRRSSVGTLQTVQSELDIAARIKWMKAREEQRQIPREFTLYLPPSLSPARLLHEPMIRRITRTTSLSLVLAQLDSILKPTLKPRRTQQQSRGSKAKGTVHVACSDHIFIDAATTAARFAFSERIVLHQGKARAGSRPRIQENTMAVKSAARKPKAWFLDVASPTWEDLQAIGKVRACILYRTHIQLSFLVASPSPSHVGRHLTT